MEDINLIDLLSLLIIFISAILAYFRGFFRELLAIVSWILSALSAFLFAPQINPLINQIPVVQEILIDSCQLSILISFVISFILILIVLSLLIPLLTNVVQQSSLNGLDRLLGLCFGALRGILIIIVIAIGYDLIFANKNDLKSLESSKTVAITFEIKEKFKKILPTTRPEWIVNRFDNLMTTCDQPTNTM